MGALDEEIQGLKEDMNQLKTYTEAGYLLHKGTLQDQNVILAKSGVGKVNAAIVSQLLIHQGVKAMIFTGVAGAVDAALKVGDIVISTDLMYHDVDLRAFEYPLGQLPNEPLYWQADASLCELAFTAARELKDIRLMQGRIASGDQFIADSERVLYLRETYQAACVEMEGAAVAQVCTKWQIPFVVIRSISDTADHSAHVDFASFSALAAARAKHVVCNLLERY